ncbi:MAG: Valyl-tRNA synthetase [Candidatus Jorgensenbacteria bacterium GW2011_GWA1_48_13]|uniref:Valine--tRNA ligase n=2 Tax=Candidatus Joergenseniibacteriota TaxID=1752739 RepID=A0A0G1Z760_9BACT|nr:MAG: Valyl-tRNA synthetase [Candidatus Jorgensenbacteria bacterium GW2011_GWA1_48_13]KKU98682.1 MAG: Valyl-tRNA synthetase [Candidatus Jorgensenbacteria bacterium GW2011_GWC1_48_8]KKW14764.1 MAG: Valyl-tRNA synthetase [Candidatus Jorgensenbacteria bacterium GW2011_GWB1_50_10]
MLDTRYDHKNLEEKIYKLWEKSGFFNPDKLLNKKAKPFTIIMPPPNANGALHMGHAVGMTLQDIMVRWNRMRGKKTLWLPGADHAGFETQVVFDKKLEKESRDRRTIPRDELYREIWNFTQKNKEIMYAQTKKLGASCDWSRETFTLDPRIIDIVYGTFEKLYKDGLVYRDLKVVNWCPKHKTALSDLEVKYAERTDPLYYIKYGPLTLATVRPETKFGDTALAVNPKDRRYKNFIGKTIEARGVLGSLKFRVIADAAVDPKFGTGVIKVTPAHDAADFEIWARHKDEIAGPKAVIDENGRLNENTGEFKGLKVAEARGAVAAKMKEIGILEKMEPNYVHQVATCYKCGSTLEPLPKPQWFVKMKPLAEPAIKALKAKKFQILPKRSEKVYLHWLKNIRDWNISRQITWGIRIPAWFHEPKCIPKIGHEKDVIKCKEIIVSPKEPKCEFCDAKYVQDPDVFDTWFSSGQWPYATLQIRGSDFKNFYPTDVMETGYDILFFWVARMVMLGIYRTGKSPFKTVYLHGLVRDKDRQKMSKSRGNVVDPLGVADLYGTDAVRMALTVGNTAGNDIVISEDKIRGYRNFATKIWNIARFVMMNEVKSGTKPKFTASDRKNLANLKKIKAQITKHLERFEFHLAAEKIYHYIWHEFADKIIEAAKPRLKSENNPDKAAAYKTIETLLTESIKMLHPFMPYVTEEIYQNLPNRSKETLMIENW